MTRPIPAPAERQPLCDARGRLEPSAIGWSERPQLDCAIPGHFGRRKRWNHWCITTPGWMLSVTLADLDYIGYCAAYFLDLETGRAVTHSQLRALAHGCHLPDVPVASHGFEHPRLHLQVDELPGRARISVAVPDIGGQPLQATLDVQRPAHLDSVNLVALSPTAASTPAPANSACRSPAACAWGAGSTRACRGTASPPSTSAAASGR